VPQQTEKPPTYSDRECSPEFADAIRQGGSIVQRCGPCGRTYFVAEGDFDQGELEGLRLDASQDPDRYVANEFVDFISWGSFFGKEIVEGCPCGYAAHVESSLWTHRSMIVKYLRDRSVRALESTQQDADEIASISELKT